MCVCVCTAAMTQLIQALCVYTAAMYPDCPSRERLCMEHGSEVAVEGRGLTSASWPLVLEPAQPW